MEEALTFTTEELDALSSTTANANQIVKIGSCFVDSMGLYNTDSPNHCTKRFVVTEDPLLAYQRLLIQFRDDPCRDACNTDESCQNYTAPDASCSADEDVVDETVDTEEEATEDTTETTADESSQTIAQSDIILVTASLASAVATLAIIALITK